MLDKLCKDVVGESLNAHIAKFLNTDAAADVFSKRSLISSSFMAPIATFLRRKTDTAMEDKKYSTASTSEEPINTVQAFNENSESLPSRSDSLSDEVSRRKSSKRRLKRFYRK